MSGSTEGKWKEIPPLQQVKAGHTSLLFDDEYIVHIGGSQDPRYEEIEVWRYKSQQDFAKVKTGPDGKLSQWQYWPNAFNV